MIGLWSFQIIIIFAQRLVHVIKRQTTIKDIAREAGVSVSTVSRALTDRWDVNPQTRLDILKVAQRLDYRPNLMARNLQNRRSRTIGVVVPEFLNSFFPKIIIGMQRVLEDADYQILILQCNESAQTERRNLQLLERNMVDGILLSISREGANDDLYKHLINAGIPIVLFNRVTDSLQVPKIIVDDYAMSKMAVEHLIAQGCRRIIHIMGPASIHQTSLRRQGYLDAMKQASLPVAYTDVIEARDMIQEDGYHIAQQLIAENQLPDALFCFNDPLAIGVLLAFKEAGIKVPQQVAICGFSESRTGQLLQLSSVEQPTEEMGKRAAQIMLQLLRNDSKEALNRLNRETICLEATLNIRNSSNRL